MSPNSAISFISKEKIAGNTEIPAPSSLEGGKTPQAAAKYRGPEIRCSNCTHFDGVNSCDVVDGVIKPDGNSDSFEAKTSGLNENRDFDDDSDDIDD